MSRQVRIQHQLTAELAPSFIKVEDESQRHHVPLGAESHFKLTLVSDCFVGQGLLQRHQRVNQLLQAEFASGMHALSMHLYTSEEWARRGGGTIPRSPACRDGYDRDVPTS